MDKTSVSDTVDEGLMPESGQAEDFRKWHSQLPCLMFSIKRDSVKTKPANSLVVSLGKALNGITPALSGRQLLVITIIKQIKKWKKEMPTCL